MLDKFGQVSYMVDTTLCMRNTMTRFNLDYSKMKCRSWTSKIDAAWCKNMSRRKSVPNQILVAFVAKLTL